jgi:hypothetical protein
MSGSSGLMLLRRLTRHRSIRPGSSSVRTWWLGATSRFGQGPLRPGLGGRVDEHKSRGDRRSHAWLPRRKGESDEAFLPQVGEMYLVSTIICSFGHDPAAGRFCHRRMSNHDILCSLTGPYREPRPVPGQCEQRCQYDPWGRTAHGCGGTASSQIRRCTRMPL